MEVNFYSPPKYFAIIYRAPIKSTLQVLYLNGSDKAQVCNLGFSINQLFYKLIRTLLLRSFPLPSYAYNLGLLGILGGGISLLLDPSMAQI